MMAGLNVAYDVVRSFALYATICVLKMLGMAFLTARQRGRKNVMCSPEDKMFFKTKEAKFITDDPDVERVRRNHLNDLENIPAFIFLGGLYVLTDPCPFLALWHFRVFAFSRLLHTIAYQLPLPQPTRALCYLAGMFVNISLGVQIIMWAL